MSSNVFASLGLTIGLGVGTAYAVHEVGELKSEAARVQEAKDEACVKYIQEHEAYSAYCPDTPRSSAEAEVLRNTAETTGNLGWIAFLGTVGCGFMTADAIQRKE